MIKIDMDYWYDCIEFIDSIHIDYIQYFNGYYWALYVNVFNNGKAQNSQGLWTFTDHLNSTLYELSNWYRVDSLI